MTPAVMFKYCFGKRVVSEETGGGSLELDDVARGQHLEAHALEAHPRLRRVRIGLAARVDALGSWDQAKTAVSTAGPSKTLAHLERSARTSPDT